jgi:hypothetical protein
MRTHTGRRTESGPSAPAAYTISPCIAPDEQTLKSGPPVPMHTRILEPVQALNTNPAAGTGNRGSGPQH